MIFRTSQHGIQRRANEQQHKVLMNQTMGFDSASHMNGYMNNGDTMMTMRSARGIKSGLAAANTWRYAEKF